jgi:hypothetical protein
MHDHDLASPILANPVRLRVHISEYLNLIFNKTSGRLIFTRYGGLKAMILDSATRSIAFAVVVVRDPHRQSTA